MVLASIAKAIFGSANDRQVKQYQPKVDAINALEPAMAKLSDGELRAKTDEFRAQLAAGTKLDDLLVPAFAVVREASQARPRHAPFRRAADRRHGAQRARASPRCVPAKARPWSRPCRSISMR